MRSYVEATIELIPVMLLVMWILMKRIQQMWKRPDEFREYVETMDELHWGTNWKSITNKQLVEMKISL